MAMALPQTRLQQKHRFSSLSSSSAEAASFARHKEKINSMNIARHEFARRPLTFILNSFFEG
jgi:hypothetical protein